jgi:hypothetical protein
VGATASLSFRISKKDIKDSLRCVNLLSLIEQVAGLGFLLLRYMLYVAQAGERLKGKQKPT